MMFKCYSPSVAWDSSKTVINLYHNIYFFLKEHFKNGITLGSAKSESNSAYMPNPSLFCLCLLPSLEGSHTHTQAVNSYTRVPEQLLKRIM